MAEQNSPERAAELVARHKARNYKGAHIREEVPHALPAAYQIAPGDPEVDPRALALQVDALTDMLGKIIVGQNVVKPQGDADVNLPKPKFDGTVSWGNILVLLGFAVSAALGYANQQSTNSHFEEGLKANAVEIAAVKKAGEDRSAKYAPVIEANARINSEQTNRQENFADSLKNLRDMLAEVINTIREQAKANADMHEAVTVLRMQLERLNPPGPRGG